MNEGLNTLKKESVLKLKVDLYIKFCKEMEATLREKLLNSFKLFTDRDTTKVAHQDVVA